MKYQQAKNNKPFKVLDLVIYGGLIAVIVALFALFVFSADHSPLTTLYADVGGQRAFTYDFASDTLTVTKEFEKLAEATDETDKITIKLAHGDGYNLIIIEKSGKAYVVEADCSLRKDCVYTSPITTTSGVIICVPHELRIYASTDYNPSLG